MIPRDFHFSSPYVFWNLLWLVPLILFMFYSLYKKNFYQSVLIEKKLQPKVIRPLSRFLSFSKMALFCLGWFFAIIALAGPIGNEYYLQEPGKQPGLHPSVELYIVIDVSKSMEVKDGRNKKSRLEAALEIADRLMALQKNDPAALLVFSSQATAAVPLTFDGIFLRLMLQEISLNEEDSTGTHFSNVIKDLKIQMEEYPKASKAVILFSDGGDLEVESATLDQRTHLIDKLADEVKALKAPVFTVGMGTKEGAIIPDVLQNGKQVISKLDEDLLMKISEVSSGRYFSGNSQSSNDIAERISQSLERARLNENRGTFISDSIGNFRNYFQIPLFISLGLFLTFYFFPTVKRANFLLFIFLIPIAGYGKDPGSIFFESENYVAASDWFKGELKHLPPEWLRNKLLYNLGTSLMAENKDQEARGAFFAISKEAYNYPLFRLRLLYNQIILLIREAEKSQDLRKAKKLKQASFILQMAEAQGCDTCPEKILDTLKPYLIPKEQIENTFDLAQLIEIIRLAGLLPNPPSLDALVKDLPNQELKTALLAKQYEAVAFSLGKIQQKEAKTPSAFLQTALDQLVIAFSLNKQEHLISMQKDASRFYPLVLEWQKRKFLEGECQCTPWDEVIPLFRDGLAMLLVKPFDNQVFYSYNKWLEALEKMQSPPSSKPLEKNDSSDVRELREMQMLDRELKPKNSKIKEGSLW